MVVLIVDDHALDRELLRAELQAAGHVVFEAADGIEALALLERERVDAIVSDVLMPNMDGLRLCRRVRAQERLRALPFIVHTGTYHAPQDEALAREVGADLFLAKRMPPRALLDALGQFGEDSARAARPSGGVAMTAEVDVIKQYSAALVRKLEEKNLELERERTLMRLLIDQIPDLIYVKDRESRFLLANQAIAQLMGVASPSELLGRTDYEFHPSERAAEFRADEVRVLSGEPLVNKEEPTLDPPGRQRIFLTTKLPLRDHAGMITALIGIGREITARKRAEEELQRAKDQFQSMFQNAIEGIYQTTPEGTYLAVNPALARMFGYPSPERLIAERRDIAQQGYVDPERREEFKRRVETEGMIIGFEYAARRRDGSVVWVSENARVVRDAEGRVLFYEGSVQDITPRRQFEQRLKLQHDVTAVLAEAGSLTLIHQRLLAAIGAGLDSNWGELWLLDRAMRVLRCAEISHPPTSEFGEFAAATRRMSFGCGHGLPGRVWASGAPEWSADVAADPACARRELAMRLRLHGWIGFPILLRNDVLGVVGFFSERVQPRDDEKFATLHAIGTQLGQFMERQQLAEQIRLAQKMEAIGTLAGGIAHDFNNIIAGISGFTELAKMQLVDDPRVAQLLDPVLKGTQRAAALVRQILAFSRRQEQQRTSLRLQPVVKEALALLRATIPTTIEFDVAIEPDLPLVLADATQIHQVLMNLCANAAHAMRERPGRLGVKLERVQVDAALAASQAGLRPGQYVRLAISDTGHGMDEETLNRIFEPFFTTKAPGEGTGLGLAVVHGIVQSHDGVITVDSQPGAGTLFRLYFPATAEVTEEAVPELAEMPKGHGERILYVDDEEPLVWISRQVLEHAGYFVETFTDPAEALASFAADPARFDLVITDLAMPKMAGTDLAERVLRIRDSVPIILVTGYANQHSSATTRPPGIREMVLKPLSVHALASTVHRVLLASKVP